MAEPARTVGAVDVDPSLPLGRIQVPQDAVWGCIVGMVAGAAVTLLLPGWWKVLGPLVGMAQVTISLWRQERIGGWKLIAARALRQRLPDKIDKEGRRRERMRLLPDGGREVMSSRPITEWGRLAVPGRVEVVTDGLIRSLDRGYMVVLKYVPPSDHWGSDEHERWARRMINSLRQVGGSQQLFTRIRRVDSSNLRIQQAQAIRESLSSSRAVLPDAAVMVEAELRHVEELAQDMYVVDHLVVLHPARSGLWTPRWQDPPRAGLDVAERLMTNSLLSLSKSGVRMRLATAEEIEAAVVAGANGGEEAYADYRTGGVSMPDGERRIVALSRPPREMLPGTLMEACSRIDAHSIVITTRLAVVPEYEAVRHLKKVARDYRDSRRHSGDGSEEIAAQTAIADAEAVIQEIFLERASSWRWQTLIEFNTRPGEAEAVLQSLITELTEMRWRPQPLRVWPLHAHAAASLGGGALKRFELLMPSTAAAYALPVMGVPFSDPRAPVIGRNELTATPVSLDLTREHTGQPGAAGNRNMALVGPTGSGKTTTLGMIIGALASRGQGALVLDYHSEMGRLVHAYGGEALELADTAVNPFAVVAPTVTLEQRELLKEAVGILAANRLPDGQRGLTPEEESWLSEAVDWFVDDWVGRARERPPLLEDFIDVVGGEARNPGSHLPVMDGKVTSDLLLRLKTWTHGRKGQTFNRHTTLDLTRSRMICLGMRKLRSSISTDNLYGPIAILMSLFYQELTMHGANEGWRRRRGYTMHLVADEAHLAFDDPMLGPALERFSREVRKYGGGVLASSQALEDFLNMRYSRVFLENAGTRLFLGVTPRTYDLVQQVSGLEDWEMNFLIQRADRGFGALIAGQEKAMVQIAPHELLVEKLLEAEAENAA